jgi:hypothetical protein
LDREKNDHPVAVRPTAPPVTDWLSILQGARTRSRHLPKPLQIENDDVRCIEPMLIVVAFA